MANKANSNPKAATQAQAAPVQIALSATAAPATGPATVPLGKYAKTAQASGLGYMPQGNVQFTLGQWPRSSRNPAAPANGQACNGATVAQAIWLAARQAGATASAPVTALQIGQAVLAHGTPANNALMGTQAAQRAFKGRQYVAQGQACGLWLQGYIGPNKGAACMANGALKLAS